MKRGEIMHQLIKTCFIKIRSLHGVHSHLECVVGAGLEGGGLGPIVHNGVGHRGIADWADLKFNLR